MDIAVPTASESEAHHHGIELFRIDAPFEDEVHVLRGVEASGVDSSASSTGQDGPDPVVGKRLADRDGHRLERAAVGESQVGLPVARGRRRSWLAALRSSGSASDSRAR